MPVLAPGAGASLWAPEIRRMNDRLVAWWDASYTHSVVQDSGNVSRLSDLSGRGYHVTASSNQPTIDKINGVPALSFNGTSTRIELATNPLYDISAKAASIVYVFKDNADPPATGNPSLSIMSNFGGGGFIDHEPFSDSVVYHGFASTARKTLGNPTPSLASPTVVSIVSAPSFWQYRINGSTFYTTTTNTVGTLSTGFSIGRGKPAGTENYYFAGRWGGTILFADALASNELLMVEAALAARFQIRLNTSASSPPLVFQ